MQVRTPFWRSTALGFGWGARASLRIVLFCGLEPGWRWSAIVELLEVLVDCLIYEEFLAINLGDVVCDVGQSTNPHAETPFPPHSLDPTSNSLNQSKVLIKCVVKVNWPTHDWITKHQCSVWTLNENRLGLSFKQNTFVPALQNQSRLKSAQVRLVKYLDHEVVSTIKVSNFLNSSCHIKVIFENYLNQSHWVTLFYRLWQ